MEIKEIPIKINNYYTCQYCKKDFIINESKKIEEDISPVCSSRCSFMIVFNYINNQAYSDENLKIMQGIIENKDEILDFSRKNAIFIITKYYMKMGFPNIKFIGQWDKINKDETKNLSNPDKRWDKMIGQHTPRGGVSNVPLSQHILEGVDSLSNHFDKKVKKKENLIKWF